ncbi:MAG: DUF1028 domain-containing protein [Alphaproteobacteria bacterium]|jgi:uncharacterized Ntn-hydrolase superfamily protein|nr:DUF1028 domain-containing protein [Alphaproteobacteria bacterium]
MTWSIVTHDAASGAFAVAVATCNFAVGASVPHIRPGVGAVASQSFSNRYLGPAILDAMARGLTPEQAIRGAVASDEGRGLRQVHAIDRHGRTAAWTGENCVMWCGHKAGASVSVAGNMLANEAVVGDTLATFLAQNGLALPERLLAAMQAGQRAGGDARGQQSAAMRLFTGEDFPDLCIRTDDHPTPLDELDRLLKLWRRDREPGLASQPRRADPAGAIDLEAIDARFKAAGSPLRVRR